MHRQKNKCSALHLVHHATKHVSSLELLLQKSHLRGYSTSGLYGGPIKTPVLHYGRCMGKGGLQYGPHLENLLTLREM